MSKTFPAMRFCLGRIHDEGGEFRIAFPPTPALSPWLPAIREAEAAANATPLPSSTKPHMLLTTAAQPAASRSPQRRSDTPTPTVRLVRVSITKGGYGGKAVFMRIEALHADMVVDDWGGYMGSLSSLPAACVRRHVPVVRSVPARFTSILAHLREKAPITIIELSDCHIADSGIETLAAHLYGAGARALVLRGGGRWPSPCPATPHPLFAPLLSVVSTGPRRP